MKKIDRNEGIKYTDKTFRTEHGFIKYRTYEDNVVVFMGSYVDKSHRGKGIFKEMLPKLLEEIKNYDIYVPVSNDIIINLFLRLGFEKTEEPIRYWRITENSVNMFRRHYKNVTEM